MKNYHIILKEDGLYLADLPIKPDYNELADSGHSIFVAASAYDKAKDQAIKDAVKLKDQDLARRLLCHTKDWPMIGFSLPAHKDYIGHYYKVDLSGYDVGIKNTCVGSIFGNCNNDRCRDCADNGRWEKFAILTPILPPKKDGSLCGNFPRVSKDNSAHSLLRLQIIDTLQNWTDQKERQLIKRKDFNDIASILATILQPSVTEESQEDIELLKFIKWSYRIREDYDPDKGYAERILAKYIKETRKPKTT